jgi:hypothetical protein
VRNLLLGFAIWVLGCTPPAYLTVPPADPTGGERGPAPAHLEQTIIRDQHLGQLRADVRFLEEEQLRAEQQRLKACRDAEAVQAGSVAYQRCQLRDQIYQQLKGEAGLARQRYLREVSGSGGIGR